MKIMYYELIKMLIEYERNKQPEVTSNKPVFISNHFSNNINPLSNVCPAINQNVSKSNLFPMTGVGRKQERWQD